jgi:hypothetical protein
MLLFLSFLDSRPSTSLVISRRLANPLVGVFFPFLRTPFLLSWGQRLMTNAQGSANEFRKSEELGRMAWGGHELSQVLPGTLYLTLLRPAGGHP